MSVSFESGRLVKTYVVVRKLDRDHCVTRYEATGEGNATSGSKYELMQYKTPVQRLDWFDEYTAYLQQITDLISTTPRLQAVWEETVEVFTLSTGSDPDHLELFRVIKPTPQSLGSLINSAQMEGGKRIPLALGLAQAVALAHQYGLVLVGLCPHTIAVRDDGSIVLRVVDWLRIKGQAAPWDGYVGDDQHCGDQEAYRAPEITNGEQASTQADVFSLGRMLLDLLADGSFDFTNGVQQADGTPPFPALRADLSQLDCLKVRNMLVACLSEDPGRRPPMEEVVAALQEHQAAAPSKSSLAVVPRWLAQPLQALAFWTAYQNEIYRHHLLPEGAIVAEFTRLISAEIGSDMILLREPLYRSLLPAGVGGWKTAIRADIAIKWREKDKPHGAESTCAAVIEVKRGNAPDSQIDEDLTSLAVLKREIPAARTFLVIASQAARPDRWVTPDGKATREEATFALPAGEGLPPSVNYRVRRVAKAASSFERQQNATYCCVIEVI